MSEAVDKPPGTGAKKKKKKGQRAKRKAAGKSPSKGIQAILAQGRAGAEQVEKGKFRLDWKRALDKIKRFQLTDPHRYVLEVVQAAIAGGATDVSVEADSDDVVMSFDGRIYTPLELERLFDYLFTQDVALAPLKQMALGINAALGMKPKFVLVESGGSRIRLADHLDLKVETIDPPLEGTRVQVRDRVSWSVVVDAFRSQTAELRLLEDECVHSPIPIRVHGEDIRAAVVLQPPNTIAVPFDEGDLRGAVYLPLTPVSQTTIDVCMNGVRVTQRASRKPSWKFDVGVHAWVDCPGFSRNASHSDVHEDETFVRAMVRIGAAIDESLRLYVHRSLVLESAEQPSMIHLRSAAMVLLRAGQGAPLSTELEALLDVPGLIELATNQPDLSSLRPFWDRHAAGEQLLHGGKRNDLPGRYLPDGLLVARSSEVPLLNAIFPGEPSDSSAELELLARGQRNRREREEMSRDPVLADRIVLVKVPVEDEATGIRGELGIPAPGLLFRDALLAEDDPATRGGKLVVTCLRNRVPLASIRLINRLLAGVAIIDSPTFQPTKSWDGIEHNGTFKAIRKVLDRHILELLRELRHAFPELPPPAEVRELEHFGTDGAIAAAMAQRNWPTDALTQHARLHVDHILAHHKRISEDQAEWLYDWRIWHRLDGTALTLRELLVAQLNVRTLVGYPWGEGAPESLTVLNLSESQSKALRRYMKGTLTSGKLGVDRRRAEMVEYAKTEQVRQRNIAASQLRRQPPELDRTRYAAVVDLERNDGTGQVGLPRFPGTPTLRYLVDGLPLQDVTFQTPLPVHAVVQCAAVTANVTFDGLANPKASKSVIASVEATYPALIAAFAGTTDVRSMEGRAILWSYLTSLKGPGGPDPFERLSVPLREAPLVATIDRGFLSLAEVYADATAHSGGARTTKLQAFRQLSERPILILNDRERDTLVRILSIRATGYTRQLEQEQEVLQRLDAPKRVAALVDAALAVRLEGEGVTGQVAILQTLVTAPSDERIGTVDVLREGVFIERTSLTLFGMPVSAVIDCPGFVPTPRWTSVARDATWTGANEAIAAAGETLFRQACESLDGGAFGLQRQAVCAALRAAAVRKFADNTSLTIQEEDSVATRLAAAAIWPSAGGQYQWVTLAQIAEQREATGSVWVVQERTGHVAPGRIIVRGAAERQALRSIFGKAVVKDGDRVLQRDDQAHQRRQSAPMLSPRLGLYDAMGIVSIEFEHVESGFRVEGQLGLRRHYASAKPGLQVRIALDGRLLCERWVEHELRALVQLDCAGLQPNRDWNGLGDASQTQTIDRLVRDASLRSLWAMIENTPAATFDRERVHACFSGLELLHAKPTASPDLLKLLMTLPLWRTVQGQTISGRQLIERFGDGAGLLVISDQAPSGSPADGRLIVRASAAAMAALQYIGISWVAHDQAWEEELAGQARRMSAVRAKPELAEDTVCQVYFQRGATSGLIGLRPPHSAVGSHQPSRVRLHVDRRYVGKRDLDWAPGVEVWVNDDRLEPTRSFLDVVSDDTLAEVLQIAQDQIPALMVRAAEEIDSARRDDPLRLQLCAYVLDVSTEDDEHHGALRRAKLWRCLTPDGIRMRSTVALEESHEAEHLAMADAEVHASAAPAGWTVVYLTEAEQPGFDAVFKDVPDHSERLRKMVVHRGFLARRKVRAVELDAVQSVGSVLWTRELTDDGWEGELAITAERGSTMNVHIFVEHRLLAVHQIVAPVGSVAAAQFAPLSANETYDDIVQGEVSKRFVRELRDEVWEGLVELAGKLDTLRSSKRDRARLVVLDAINRRRSEKKGADPVLRTLEAAPLLPDYAGRLWSIEGVRRATKGKVPAVSAANAKRGAPLDEGVVLVLDDELWSAVHAVLPVKSFNDRYLQQVEARERMERAPTSHRFSRRNTLVLEEVQGETMHGELGLARDLEDAGVALFHRDRVVEVYRAVRKPGLVGTLRGEWKVNQEFTRVSINRDHADELDGLYADRLEAAALEAAEQKRPGRGRTWDALAAYTVRYLQRSLSRAGGNRQERLDRVLTRAPELDASVRRALDARVVRRMDGDWVDVPSILSGEEPMVVICEERIRRPPKTDAVLVYNSDGLIDVVSGLLGSDKVLGYESWRDKLRDQELAKKKKSKQVTGEEGGRRQASQLKSLLREAVGKHGGGLSLRVIGKLHCAPIPGCDDLVQMQDRIVVNTEHRAWKEALQAPLGARALFHLAAAVLTDMSWGTDALLTGNNRTGEEQLRVLLARLAAHASSR